MKFGSRGVGVEYHGVRSDGMHSSTSRTVFLSPLPSWSLAYTPESFSCFSCGGWIADWSAGSIGPHPFCGMNFFASVAL